MEKKINEKVELKDEAMEEVNGGSLDRSQDPMVNYQLQKVYENKCPRCGGTTMGPMEYFDETWTTRSYYKTCSKCGLKFIYVEKDSCLIPGTKVAMADGTNKNVEDIVIGDQVLTWNFYTGKIDSQPVMFNHVQDIQLQEVIYATFSDGSQVGIVWEHGFFDVTKSKYIFMREDAAQYIGDTFAKINRDGSYSFVTLENIAIKREFLGVYSPITNKNQPIITNGLLSITGGVESLVNTFDFIGSKMVVDIIEMLNDVEKYGLLPYEAIKDFAPFELYEAFDASYLGVAIGKGLTTLDEIKFLVYRYADILDIEKDHLMNIAL